jgi:hypothetical protein
MGEQAVTIIRQTESPGGSMEQAYAEMLLQLCHLPGDGRLAAPCFARDRGKGPGLRHAGEASDRPDQVHYFTIPRKYAMPKTKVIPTRLTAYVAAIARRTGAITYSSGAELHHDLSAGQLIRWRLTMKNLVLAAAAVVALGTGTAVAHNGVDAHQAAGDQSAQAVSQAEFAFATTSRDRTWIYPAFGNNGGGEGTQQ